MGDGTVEARIRRLAHIVEGIVAVSRSNVVLVPGRGPKISGDLVCFLSVIGGIQTTLLGVTGMGLLRLCTNRSALRGQSSGERNVTAPLSGMRDYLRAVPVAPVATSVARFPCSGRGRGYARLIRLNLDGTLTCQAGSGRESVGRESMFCHSVRGGRKRAVTSTFRCSWGIMTIATRAFDVGSMRPAGD
jgi:hypothetical protein